MTPAVGVGAKVSLRPSLIRRRDGKGVTGRLRVFRPAGAGARLSTESIMSSQPVTVKRPSSSIVAAPGPAPATSIEKCRSRDYSSHRRHDGRRPRRASNYPSLKWQPNNASPIDNVAISATFLPANSREALHAYSITSRNSPGSCGGDLRERARVDAALVACDDRHQRSILPPAS